jgi:PTH1 family peptidyl-tRNA hydrolase
MGWLRRDRPVSTLDLLVAGLGNPGREYARNRHNVGFMVIEELARRNDARFRAKFHGRLVELRFEGRRVALLAPETFMNESGRSLAAATRFFKLTPERLLVVHDDVDLEPGRLQLRLGGGLAGHNGLRSIAAVLATREFLRLRVGVGRPGRGDRRSVADFVLSNFDSSSDVEAIVSRAADAVELVAREGLEVAQARFNEREP